MRRVSLATIILTVFLTLGALAARGDDLCAVTLRSGETILGDLKAEGSRAIITSSGKDRVVEFPEILTLRRLSAQVRVGQSSTGLKGEYFSNEQLKGTPRVRLDHHVNFVWSSDTLPENMPGQGYSIRWTGQLEPAFTEDYTFSFWHGRRTGKIWVGEDLIVDYTSREGTVALQAGKKVSIRVEATYGKDGGAAILRWQSASQRREIIPAERLTPPSDFSAEKHAAEILADAGRGLKAEYSADGTFKNIRIVTLEHQIGSHPDRKIGQSYAGRWTGKVYYAAGERYGVRLQVPGAAKVDTLIDDKPAENFPLPVVVPGGGAGAWHNLSITARNIPVWSDPNFGHWDPRGWMADLPATHLKCPDDMPVVALLSPPPGSIVSAADKTLTLEAAAGIEKGKIARVEFLLDGAVVGGADRAPYRSTISDLQSGTHPLVLRVSSEAGVKSSVPAGEVIVRAPVETMGLPWWEMPIGRTTDHVTVTLDAGKYRLATRAGSLAEKRDTVMMVGQDLPHGDMVFRVGSLKTVGRAGEASLSLQCRESLEDAARALSLTLTSAGSGSVTTRNHGVSVTEDAPLSLPCYLRLQVAEASATGGPGPARVFSSADGKTWHLHGTLSASAPGTLWRAGIVLTSLPAGVNVEAEIDQVRVQGMPVLGPGIELVDGSLIAGKTGKLDGERIDLRRPDEKTWSIPKATISKVLITSAALPPTAPEADKEGVYIGEMDLCEGKLVSAGADVVTVDSVIFGLQRYKTADLRAITWRGVQPEPRAFEVLTRDGSRWRVKDPPAVRAGKIILKHPLGEVELFPAAVLEISAGK